VSGKEWQMERHVDRDADTDIQRHRDRDMSECVGGWLGVKV
jgi:hypothetical protein